MPRQYGPLAAGHPLIGERCPACGVHFIPDDRVTLVPVGPGPEPDARAAAREGRAYSAVAVAVHWACATGEEG
jgi:hypothetical protein